MTASRVFEQHGMKIYDVEELETHGGSLRIYATLLTNENYTVSSNVSRVICDEKEYGFENMETYQAFAARVTKIKRDSCNLLIKLKEEGKRVAAFGAAAKGNTFLNYCGIGKEYIDFVADSSTEKQGLYLPGTRLPIVSPEKIREERPDYIVFLAWNLKEEFSQMLEYTREWGCKFITFIPETEVF